MPRGDARQTHQAIERWMRVLYEQADIGSTQLKQTLERLPTLLAHNGAQVRGAGLPDEQMILEGVPDPRVAQLAGRGVRNDRRLAMQCYKCHSLDLLCPRL